MVSFDGGSASKVDDVTALPSRHKMADMCYYGNVMTTTRWRLSYIFNSTVIDWTFFFISNGRDIGYLSLTYATNKSRILEVTL